MNKPKFDGIAKDVLPSYVPSPLKLLKMSQWRDAEIPEPDILLGDFLTTKSRTLLVGGTGTGKTMFAMGVAGAVANGAGFLHWEAGRKGRVLYVEGEMDTFDIKSRLYGMVNRGGYDWDDTDLKVLTGEEYPEIEPLNTEGGQRWLDSFIKMEGPFDLIIFDNIQALLLGSMKEEEHWLAVLPWIQKLSHQGIGQIWVHHANQDGGSYGSKIREWRMHNVILMSGNGDPTTIDFDLKFGKSRSARPGGRHNYRSVRVQLPNDHWVVGDAEVSSKPKKRDLALDALKKGVAEAGKKVPGGDSNILAIEKTLWRKYADQNGTTGAGNNEKSRTAMFDREVRSLLKDSKVMMQDPWCWPLETS